MRMRVRKRGARARENSNLSRRILPWVPASSIALRLIILRAVLTYSRQNRGFVDRPVGFTRFCWLWQSEHKNCSQRLREWLLKRNVCLLWFLCFKITKQENVIQSGARLSSRDFSRAFFLSFFYVFSVLWLQRCHKLKLTWLSEFVHFSLNNYWSKADTVPHKFRRVQTIYTV